LPSVLSGTLIGHDVDVSDHFVSLEALVKLIILPFASLSIVVDE
jgi:hypothetical protein